MKIADEIVMELKKNREELLEEHGGIDGYLNYLKNQNARWLSEGFVSMSLEEVLERQKQQEVQFVQGW